MLVVAWLLLALACGVAIVHGARVWSAPPSVDVLVRMSTTTHGNGQIFTRADDGYSEQRSVTFALVGDGLAHDYATRLSGLAAPGAFRIDPGSSTGRVTLHWIDVGSLRGSIRLQGPALRQAVRPLKELMQDGGADGLSFRSQGTDPFMEVVLPEAVLRGYKTRQHRGLLLAVSGLAGFLALLWLARFRIRTAAARGPALNSRGLFAIAAILGLAMLAALRTGCDGVCSPNGVRYGAALLLAALGMGVIGAAIMQGMGLGAAHRRARLFMWIAVGQTALILYVFVRSALHGVLPFLPLSAAEPAFLVLAAAAYLWATWPLATCPQRPRSAAWPAVELALLAVVCLVVADRELPRLVMLSSDPDTHAYLARQLERLGGIPWHGELVFNYPAGSAAMGFIWGNLSLLDVRNAMSALPLLQSFLAALLLGEALALRVRPIPDRLLVLLTTLGVTAAGFLIPLYVNFSHMEGTGRQIAIASAALVPALLLAGNKARADADRPMAAMLLASLFTLAVLNPISIVVPVILSIAYVLYLAFAKRLMSGWWAAALLACPLLLLLDPYYFHLISGSASSVSKITVNVAMPVKDVTEIIAAWQLDHLSRPLGFLLDARTMARGQAAPMFAVFLVSLFSVRMLLKPTLRTSRAALLAIALAVVGLAAADGLFAALRDDRRFYLLSPYYAFTLAQLKILLVTALAGSVIVSGSARRLPRSVLTGLAVVMVLIVYVGMRSTQKFALVPRAGYCGSLGCVSADDIAVMSRFEQMIRSDGHLLAGPARILVPNSVHDTQNEDWVFPVTGARALPFFDVPPVAFFYYQGDDDYTTENYKTHVCRQFDRDWLKRQQVAYVFLPSNRESACMKDMERLPMTEHVVIRQGASYLLKLR